MKNRIIILLSFALYFIAYPVLKPYKMYKSYIFKKRKDEACALANKLSNEKGCNIYVVQIGMNFKVGNRAELRRFNKFGTKWLKNGSRKYAVSHVTFDYRTAIIYTAHA